MTVVGLRRRSSRQTRPNGRAHRAVVQVVAVSRDPLPFIAFDAIGQIGRLLKGTCSHIIIFRNDYVPP